VFSEGIKTGRLLFLKTGLVSIVKGGTEIAKMSEPGVVFGEISALLDKPHTADVLTLAPSQFHVADAAAFLVQEQPRSFTLRQTWPGVLMAPTKPSSAQLKAGEPPGLIDKTVERIEGLLTRLAKILRQADSGETVSGI
jgi:CRP-like cAMP-binding protein